MFSERNNVLRFQESNNIHTLECLVFLLGRMNQSSVQQLGGSLSESHESLWRCEPANTPWIAVGRVPERPAKIRARVPTKVDGA
jgi:hypothetical protein